MELMAKGKGSADTEQKGRAARGGTLPADKTSQLKGIMFFVVLLT